MKAEIIFVPARRDNYCYLVHEVDALDSDKALVIDPSDAAPIERALAAHGLRLKWIINTHHHHDHVGGNEELVAKWNAQVACSRYDVDRVPRATRGLREGEPYDFYGLRFEVIEIPGHTLGQIALYLASERALFVGDTLFSVGCGRLFEGSPEQMWTSLKKLAALPPDTRIYFGHEYTEKNVEFALGMKPSPADAENLEARRSNARASVAQRGYFEAPTLQEELSINPFLKASNLSDFTKLRQARDVF